jgi:glutathione S-transferase
MYKVYGDMLSGNCYKIKMLLTFLNIEHEWIHVDILNGETQTEAFKSINPNGKIPLLVINDGQVLAESNAILNYLAEGTEYLPRSKFERASVLQWQFFEQYSHEPYIAVARYINKYLGLPSDRMAEYESKQSGGHKALKVMEEHLANKTYFVANKISIADISLFAYTQVAHEGGFDLAGYPNILAWIKRIQDLPDYIEMAR